MVLTKARLLKHDFRNFWFRFPSFSAGFQGKNGYSFGRKSGFSFWFQLCLREEVEVFKFFCLLCPFFCRERCRLCRGPFRDSSLCFNRPRKRKKTNPVKEQRRVDLATFRAVPASTWGHCPQVLCFTIVWETPEKGKVAKWSSGPASILEGFN